MWVHEHLLVIKQDSEQSRNLIWSSWAVQTSTQTAKRHLGRVWKFIFPFFPRCKCDSFCVPAYIRLQHPSPLALLVWHRRTPAVPPHLLSRWAQAFRPRKNSEKNNSRLRGRHYSLCVSACLFEGCVQVFDMYTCVYCMSISFSHFIMSLDIVARGIL